MGRGGAGREGGRGEAGAVAGYRLVVAHLPRAERPVDPHTYGTGTGAVR
ncbi:hypothetical protein OG342_34650 [Streptomyces bobili]|nr:hypothetical protein [Streptomyces bobili]